MKREEFVSLFSQNRVFEMSKKGVWGMTFDLTFLRFNMPSRYYASEITITPKYTYIPNSIYRKVRVFKKTIDDLMNALTNDYEGEFILKGEVTYPFNYESLRSKLKIDSSKLEMDRSMNFNPFVVETKLDWYMKGLMLSDSTDIRSILRFNPLKSELKMLSEYIVLSPNVLVAGKNFTVFSELEEQVAANELFQEMLVEHYEAMFVSTRNYDFKERATLKNDYRTLLTEKLSQDLTLAKFDYWLRSRHDIFGELCMKILGINSTEDMDVNMETRFNYMGPDFYKTPDAVLETDDFILILDFAVTTGSSGNVRENKIKKYSELALGLKKHTNKNVTCEAIVWKINSMEDIQIPSEFSEYNLREELMESEVMKFLHKVHLEVSMMENYDKYRTMNEDEDLEENEDASIKLERLKKMNSIIVGNHMNLSNIKSKDFDSYRDRERGSKAEFKLLKDTKFMEDMVGHSMINDKYYLSSVSSLLEMKIDKSKFPPHLEKILEEDVDDLTMFITNITNKEMKTRVEFMENLDYTLPNLFKFPVLCRSKLSMENPLCNMNPDFDGADHETSDGTLYFRHTFDFSIQKSKEKIKKTKKYPINGIGTNIKDDTTAVEAVLEFFKDDSVNFESDFLLDQRKHMDKPLLDFLKTNAWAFIETISDLYLNLAYLEGRRHVFDSASGHTVLKNFGHYYLLIKKGSKLTSQKAIRFKIICEKESVMVNTGEIYHNMKDSDTYLGFMESSWLSATITDIRHFEKMRYVAFAMASNYYDKLREMNRGVERQYDIRDNVFMTYVLILMEHKRHTSTTLQLNRYLMHSSTSYISNHKALVKDIFKSPTRTIVDSYVKGMQMKWYDMMLKTSKNFSYNRIVNMNSTANSYDRFDLPSMFDNSIKLEFSLVMDEIYLGNLFDKEAGFDSHRVKSIVEKMETEEMHFQRVNLDTKKKLWSRGIVDDLDEFISSEDETHMFDRSFVVSATKKYFREKVNQVKLQEALMVALRSTIEPAMMMTSSLVGGPYESECLDFEKNIRKTKSFLSLYSMIKKMSSHMLIEMCNNMDKVDAIFAMFPKSQIGGPREILIQAVMLRVLVKFLETISKKFCSVHEKEMLTKDKVKAELQSDKMAEFRETLRMLNSRDESSMYFSLNTDASRWAPGFVMEHFIYFINEWDIDEELKIMLMTVVSAFSSKTMLVPEILKRKWENKDMSDKEFMEGVQSFREQAVEHSYTVEIMSGMGQGMLHYLSSMYHAVMDDSIMDITRSVLLVKRNVLIKDVTMLSSDDKTRMVLMLFKSGPKDADKVLKEYIYLQDTLSRMCNIHFNWKKSGMNFAITEFNSLFSVGKRMTWASIKDIYTSNSIPDLTAPEEAINFMISNIRRCLEHGVYLTTIKWMMEMAREQLKKYYRYDEDVISELMRVLNCSEDRLPFHLGFFPTTMEVETLIYGPEIHMYRLGNSPELEKFYDNMYKSNLVTHNGRSKKSVPFSEDSKGKFWLELPSRLDKKLKEMKDNFYSHELMEKPEEVMKKADRMALDINLYNTDPKKNKDFTNTYFVGMNRKYEFQETMVVHSLIRALSMTNGKARMYPLSNTETELIETIKQKRREYEMRGSNSINNSRLLSEISALEEEYDSYGMDVLKFTNIILNLDSVGESARKLYSGLSSVVDNYNNVVHKLNNMTRSYKYLHPTMKAIRFYTNKVGSSTKPEDLINHLFDVSHNSSNSATNMMEDLIDLAGYDRRFTKSLYNNPFRFVKRLMSASEFKNKSFYDFVKLNYKSMKYVKITMLSDFMDAGNMEENILNLYRTKATPCYYYQNSNTNMSSNDYTLEFLTHYSMGNMEFNRLDYEDASYISQKDNKVIRAMKMNYFYMKDREKGLDYSNSSNIMSSKFDYKMWKDKKTKRKCHAWNNINSMVVCKEKDNKMIDVLVYMDPSNLEDDSAKYLKLMFSRFMSEKEREGFKFLFKTTGNKDINYGLMFDYRPMFFKTMLRYYSTKWTMSYKVLVSRSANLWTNDNLEIEFPLLVDNYTVESKFFMQHKLKMNEDDEDIDMMTMRDIIDESPDILRLDQIIKVNNMLTDLNMVENEANDDDTRYTIEAMNESFGVASLKDTLSKLVLGESLGMLNRRSSSPISDMEDAPTGLEGGIIDSSMSPDPENLFNDKGLLLGLKEALELAHTHKGEEEVEDTNNWERTSRIKILDQLVTSAVKTEIVVDKEQMTSLFNNTRRMNKTSSFHNMLLFQIMDMYDFEISDNMAIMVYNVILKNFMPFTLVEPTSKLKKYSKEIRAKLASESRFVQLRFSEEKLKMEDDLDLFS
jgi:hypothetical protein